MRYFFRNSFSVFILLLGVSQLFISPALADKVRINSNIKQFISGTAKTLRLSFKTPAGIERVTLRQTTDDERFLGIFARDMKLTLLQGVRDSRGLSRGRFKELSAAGASILDGKFLRLRFIGRRGRPYELSASFSKEQIESGELIFGRLRHLYRNKKIPCAGARMLTANEFIAKEARATLFRSRGNSKDMAGTYRVEVAVDADAEYSDYYGSRLSEQIAALFNDIEAIYFSQLGIELRLVKQRSFVNKASQPYSALDSFALLEQFRSHVNRSGRLGDFDVAHLLTAKSLEGAIIGLAYLGTACTNAAFGLSQETNPLINYLTAAHEIGHNLNATHDYGDSYNGPNNPAYRGYLMNAEVEASNTSFSDYSANEILNFVSSSEASCLQTASNPLSLNARIANRTRRARLKMDLFFNVEEELCSSEGSQWTLYGATRKTYFNQTPELSTNPRIEKIGSWPFNGENFQQLISQFRSASTRLRKKRAFLIAELSCSDGISYRSRPDRIKASFRSSRGFLRRLKTKSPTLLD